MVVHGHVICMGVYMVNQLILLVLRESCTGTKEEKIMTKVDVQFFKIVCHTSQAVEHITQKLLSLNQTQTVL